MSEITQILKKYLDSADAETKNYLKSEEWLVKLNKIFEELGLSELDQEKIKTEVIMVLLGISEYKEFRNNISLPYNKKNILIEKVDDQIFFPFSEKISSTNISSSKLDYSQIEVPLSVQEIGNAYNLNQEEMGKLAYLIKQVLDGEKSASTFEFDVAELLSLKTDQARYLTKEIDEKVFAPVRESIKEEPPEETGAQNNFFQQKAQDISLSEHQKEAIIPPPVRKPGEDPYREPLE